MSCARRVTLAVALALVPVGPASSATESLDAFGQALVDRGLQALTVCNGLFVSNRSLQQIYRGELRAYLPGALPESRIRIDQGRRLVEVGIGAEDGVPIMRAVFREGLGCIVMSSTQTLADVDQLPELRLPPPAGDPATVDWPEGDRVQPKPLSPGVEQERLEAAGRWAFDRVGHGGHAGQVTLSLLVVHHGNLVLERYADDVDHRSRFRTWSVAKTILGTLVGIAVAQGKLKLDEPLPIAWPPDEFKQLEERYKSGTQMLALGSWPPPGLTRAPDPRRRITLRHVLNLSSGLYPVDDEGLGSMLVYFGGFSAERASDRGLVHEPGTVWNYENYDSLLAMLALKSVLGSQSAVLAFPRRELFDRIGMRSTLPGVDRFGNFVLSSQVYANARDLARLGLLYLDRGMWKGQRVLAESWVDFSRTPAPATARFGKFYGGTFWLVPDARTDITQDAYAMSGAYGQYVFIVPSRRLVIVRRGLDAGRPSFPAWDLVAEVLKAFPPGGAARKVASAGPIR